jgi:hypothetical protein
VGFRRGCFSLPATRFGDTAAPSVAWSGAPHVGSSEIEGAISAAMEPGAIAAWRSYSQRGLASAMQLLLHPRMDERDLIDSTRGCDLAERGPFVGGERDRHGRAHEDRLGDLLELIVEVRHVVRVPELRQFTNGRDTPGDAWRTTSSPATACPSSSRPRTMFIERDNRRITSVHDWLEVAPPKGGVAHWVPGRSARELAEAWCGPDGPVVPPEIARLLQSHADLREVAMRIGRFSGLWPSLRLRGKSTDPPAVKRGTMFRKSVLSNLVISSILPVSPCRAGRTGRSRCPALRASAAPPAPVRATATSCLDRLESSLMSQVCLGQGSSPREAGQANSVD